MRRASTIARLRAGVLLAGVGLCALDLGGGPVRATDATWNNPATVTGMFGGTFDYNAAANWTPAIVPDGTAFFGVSTTTIVEVNNVPPVTTVGGWTFNVGASAYTFSIVNAAMLNFNGAGIAINGGSAVMDVFPTAVVQFQNSSTAGSATFDNNGATTFQDTSTAGSANITNGLVLEFQGNSTAGTATIVNNAATIFGNSSTAGNAAITNNGLLSFDDSSTAGNAGITNSGTLFFGQTGDTTYTGVISGGGTVDKTGTGTLIMTNTNTYNGATTIDGGTLQVDGSIALSSVGVNSGGTLGGNGTVGPTTVNSGGTLSPGASIGTLNVTGDLTFNAGSTYKVEVSPTAADRTNVTGAANLAGTVNAVFTGGTYTSNSYTILSAGVRNGTFDALTTSGLPFYLSASLGYTATDVLLLTLASNLQISAQTRNQSAVAGALDTAFNNGFGLLPGFGSLTQAQMPAALDALSGELHPSVQTTLIEDSFFMRHAIFGRLRQAAFGGTGNTMAALGTGGPALAYGAEAAQAYAAFPVHAAPAHLQSDYTYWATVLGNWGHTDSDGNAAKATRDLVGFVSGIDKSFGAWRLGAAAGYTSANVHVDDRASSAKVDSYHVAGYAAASFGALIARGGAAFAWHEIDANRTAAYPGFSDRLSASYHATTTQVFGELGYGIDWAGLALEPFYEYAWVGVHTGSFNEAGGAAALSGASENQDGGPCDARRPCRQVHRARRRTNAHPARDACLAARLRPRRPDDGDDLRQHRRRLHRRRPADRAGQRADRGRLRLGDQQPRLARGFLFRQDHATRRRQRRQRAVHLALLMGPRRGGG